MKVFRVVALGIAVAIPSFSMAELPFSKPGLGQIEAMLDYCSQTNPKAAEKFKDHGKRLVRGLPGAEVEEARKSEEYQKSYKSTMTELGKVSKEDAAQACNAFLEGKE